MTIDKEEIITYRPDGKVDYVDTWEKVAPMWYPEYPNYRVRADGSRWVRTGENKKYNKDGSLRWRILYDSHGNVVKT